jgi:glycosyltransferase involved in cell wall biosynthesis
MICFHPVPLFSFIIPTRGNPDSLLRLCDCIRACTRRLDELEIVLVIDTDDQATRQLELPALNIRKVEGPPGRNMAALITAGYRAATGQYLMLLNDDVVLRTPSWDDRVTEVFRSFPDDIVLVHVNDTIFRETLCTFPCLPRTYCELVGGICADGYLRYRIDDHIHNVFDLLSAIGYHRRIYLPDVVFEHLNLTPTKDGYGYVVDPEIHAVDSQRFRALLPDRRRFVLAAAERIDRQALTQNRTVWEAKLEAASDCEAIRHATYPRWCFANQSVSVNARVTVAVTSADPCVDNSRLCIERIKKHTSDYDLVIVDTHRPNALHRGGERNRLLEYCRTDYVVLMDDDVLVEQGWLEGLTRALEPPVGVVTPVHKDRTGSLSYAGITLQPRDPGGSAHLLTIGEQPRHIQTLSGAIMLIDMRRCGHVRMEEACSGHFTDIDYGLRIWEQGFEVVCTPWTQVTHIRCGEIAPDTCRLDTHRIEALRRGVWSEVPEFVEMARLQAERDIRLAAAAAAVGAAAAAVPDPLPVVEPFVEAIFEDLPRLEPLSLDPLAPGFGAAMKRLTRSLPYLYSLRPRIVIRRGANLFDPAWYRTAYPDVAAHGANPFLHFLTAGAFEGRDPHPLFDTAFYLNTYPDVAAARVNPLGHYLTRGAAEGRQPHSLFDSVFYLNRYPDVRVSGLNPLVHYVLYGAAEGRQPHPWFQPNYYLDHCGNRGQAAANPLLHFLQADPRQCTDPHPQFDCQYYLRRNPGVAATGMNPLVHYVLFGARAGRWPNASHGLELTHQS